MLKLLDSLDSFESEKNYALAMITETQGSTYRKAGAMMLISESLEYWGLISGGCLEGDVLENSRNVFSEGSDIELEYDMRGDEDLLWGLGLGCDGAVKLLIKFLPATENHFGFFEMLKSLDNGQSSALNISFSDNNRISFHKMEKSGDYANDVRASQAEDSTQFSVPMIAPVNLLICGASPDVPPVTSIARQLGWKTTVIDHRKDFASINKFPDATQVEHIRRSQWNEYGLSTFDACVIMSHQFERDEAYLKKLLKSQIGYIGLLGPSKRRDKLLAACESDFSKQQGRLFGPVGLDIGADTPETIALAIVAEIQAVKAKKSVGFCYEDLSR